MKIRIIWDDTIHPQDDPHFEFWKKGTGENEEQWEFTVIVSGSECYHSGLYNKTDNVYENSMNYILYYFIKLYLFI